MIEKRKKWKEQITPEMVQHLVFPDEGGINTDLARHYGRNRSSERILGYAPLYTTKSTTILSSVWIMGEKAVTTYLGGTTSKRFVSYLKEVLIPTLKPSDFVVIDNMRSHHVKAVEDLWQQNGMHPLHIPLYSLDLNPIENMWSKMKALLRKWKIHKSDLLETAISRGLSLVPVSDCLHWFQNAGYCQ